ncbi:MAG: adenylate cyclase [Limisphaerales bacterium]|nr:MAG: adenylate cyclase [Limisphaerales bacterium]KAG0508181.1 MAG: adenylate cyclase [Limisphaerales bacterium]TXT51407.1 MAG: adenylate cyclase [Limisphaerales bacterium]
MTDKTMFRLNPAKNPFLGNLPEAALEDLIGRAKIQQLHEGDVFIREGEPSDSIYFINFGDVVILKGGVEIDHQHAGGVIGEMGVLTNAPRSATIKCAGEVELLRVEAEDFVRIVDSQPAMLRNLVIDQLKKVTSSQDVRVNQGKQIVEAKEVFGRLVSPEVYERVISKRKPEEMLSGTLEDAAVLFFDIRGFSNASEKMGPQPLLKALNDHLGIINARVSKHRGTIVNFIGDAVLAIFGCPVPLPDAAGAAVRCYLEAREELNAFHQHRRATGEHCFDLGAGINFGGLVSGAIGSKERMSYSVLGDEVNLAARLEGLTRYYPTEVIFSESCYDQLPGDLKQEALLMDRCTVKGRKSPTGLYTLLPMPNADREAYDAALNKYLSGDFLAAESAFNAIPGPLAAYMRRRCGQLQVEQGKFWPGYYSWEVK